MVEKAFVMATEAITPSQREVEMLKCVIWDLDDTLWNGTLAEGDNVRLRPEADDAIHELDKRGILQSIASRNDHSQALAMLARFGLADYFLHPQIGWEQKSNSVARVASLLNIGLSSVAFVDDQIFERAEVAFTHSEVRCFDGNDLSHMLAHPALNPKDVTDEARSRRLLYLSDMRRQEEEQRFEGCKETFLAGLGMRMLILPADQANLDRAAELTARTNQLNTTGYVFSREELDRFSTSPDHLVVVARLEDKYGTYGTIGVALAEIGDATMLIKLLLMSCRVMSRGVGVVMLSYLIKVAHKRGLQLRVEFIPNDRNRMMEVTLRFAEFKDCEVRNGVVILERDMQHIPDYPDYIHVSA